MPKKETKSKARDKKKAKRKAAEPEIVKLGRPDKLTPEITEAIISAIRAGAYIETAAAFAGICKDTFYRWLKEGARGECKKKAQFSDAVKMALAESELRDLAVVNRAASTSWQAAAWKLERKFPDRWGRRDRLDVAAAGSDDSKPIAITYRALSAPIPDTGSG